MVPAVASLVLVEAASRKNAGAAAGALECTVCCDHPHPYCEAFADTMALSQGVAVHRAGASGQRDCARLTMR